MGRGGGQAGYFSVRVNSGLPRRSRFHGWSATAPCQYLHTALEPEPWALRVGYARACPPSAAPPFLLAASRSDNVRDNGADARGILKSGTVHSPTYLPIYPPTYDVAPWNTSLARTSAFESNIPPRIRGMRTFLIAGVARARRNSAFQRRRVSLAIAETGDLGVDSRASPSRDSTEPRANSYVENLESFSLFFFYFYLALGAAFLAR